MNEPDEADRDGDAGDAGEGSDGGERGEETQNGAHGAGAMPPARRGGRPKGSRNRATIAREQGVAAPAPETSRPAGKTGGFPDEVEGKIPNDADQLWMFVIDEITAKGWSPYDMEIRVDRKTPPPAGPVTEFEASAVMGDAQTSPATALRKYMRDWVHLPSGLQGPAVYDLHFCWKNQARFFRRGEMKMPSRNECIAMKQSEEARAAQAGVAGLPTPSFPQPQHAPQPAHAPPPQPYYGYAPQPPQPEQRSPEPRPAPQPHFDPEVERARIRAELDREYEMRDLRRELDELRRRPQYGPGLGNGYPPPQTRRGVGGPMPQYEEDPDTRTARVVVSVLQQMGIGPQQQPAPVGAGRSPVIESAQQQIAGAADDLERVMDSFTRGKKVYRRMREVFGEEGEEEETPKAKPKGTGAVPEGEEEQPQKIRFQDTGQLWKDGRKVMMPIDEAGDPILPTTIPAALATGFANPFLLEPIAAGVGELIKTGTQLVQGLGKPPQQAPLRDPSIHVQQAPQPAPPPQPYYPPQQMPAPQPPPQQTAPSPASTSSDDGWNLT